PHLCAAVAHMAEDYRTISPSELAAYTAWLDAGMMGYEDSFLQYRAGALSEKSWETDAAILRAFAANPAFRTEWSFVRAITANEYRDYLDDLIRNTPINKRAFTHADWLARYEEQLAS